MKNRAKALAAWNKAAAELAVEKLREVQARAAAGDQEAIAELAHRAEMSRENGRRGGRPPLHPEQLAKPCPTCGASEGRACRSKGGRPRKTHSARL